MKRCVVFGLLALALAAQAVPLDSALGRHTQSSAAVLRDLTAHMSLSSQAAPRKAARGGAGLINLRVTDLAGTTFAVTFATKNEVTAAVRYGTSATKLGLTARDDRDTAAGAAHAPLRSDVHRIRLFGLTPSTSYYYEPIVDGVAQTAAEGQPFKQATASTLNPGIPTRVYGTVITARKTVPAAGGVLVVGQWINLDGSASWPVSVFNGGPNRNRTASTFDLVSSLLTANGRGPFIPTDKSVFRLVVTADVQAHLVMAKPISVRRGVNITIAPLVTL